MNLDFDLGNTRIKWRLQSVGASEYGAAAWRELESSSESLKKLLQRIQQLNADGIEELNVNVSSVAGPKTEELFNLWLYEKLNTKAHYIQVKKEFACVRVGYEDISRLGVDRWLAMVAAHEFTRESKPAFNVVIDAGSAITIDYIDPKGEHEGGLIVPGLPLLRASMSSGTHNLRPESLTLPQNWKPACDTVSGISAGASAMYVGLVKEALDYYIRKADAHGEPVRLCLSGGDARVLLPWCESHLGAEHIILRDYLVLDGMEVWRKHQSRG